MSKSALHAVRTKNAPTTEMDTEPRRRWLTEAEVETIISHADSERDRLMILMAYRHGFRVSELIGLTWRQVDLDAARLRVIRAKGSEDGVHPLSGREIRALRNLWRRQAVGAPWVFVTSRRGPMTRNGADCSTGVGGSTAGHSTNATRPRVPNSRRRPRNIEIEPG